MPHIGPRGNALARLLRGSWRSEPPALSRDEVAAARPLAPLLLKGGIAGLAWRRLPGEDPALFELRAALWLSTLEAAVHEKRVARAAGAFRRAGVDALVGKGWAIARRYPLPGLRPYGDVDIYVDPKHERAARRVLADPAGEDLAVDLHVDAWETRDQPWPQLWERSLRPRLLGTEVRTFGSEDHARLIALHAAKHGLRRPLWLVDLALLLESDAASLDWNQVLGGEAQRSRVVMLVLRLARELLGPDIENPPQFLDEKAPAWARRAVLAAWGSETGILPQGRRVPWLQVPRRPRELLRALRERWPNPVEASVATGAPLRGVPRAAIQGLAMAQLGVNHARRHARRPPAR